MNKFYHNNLPKLSQEEIEKPKWSLNVIEETESRKILGHIEF